MKQIVFALLGALLALTACNKDSVKTDYECRLTVESAAPTADAEARAISEAFEKALGGKTFTREGDAAISDLRIIGICQSVESSFEGRKWDGSYTFEVLNRTEGTIVYHHTFATPLDLNPDGGDDEKEIV